MTTIKDSSEILSNEKLRDIIKSCILKSADGFDILMIGIENQSDIHYAMPVRNLLYDAINYASQTEQVSRRHKKDRDLKQTDFLSGFSKKDRLIPVITITIYFDNKSWDGPRSLHEMFDIKNTSVLQYVDDYHLHLIIPEEIQDFDNFHTQLGCVMKFIAASSNRQRLEQVLSDRKFECMEWDAAAVLEVCTDIKIPEQLKTEGGINMCKAWEEQYISGQSEGRKAGRKEGMQEARITIFKNMIKRGFPAEEATALAELTEDTAQKILAEMKQFQ